MMLLKSAFVLLMLVQSIEDVYKAANADMEAQRWDDAIAKFEQVLKEDATHVPTMFGLAVSYSKIGNNEKAIEVYRRILGQDSNVYEAHVNLGILLLETGDTEGGSKELEASVALSPDSPEGRLKAASAYFSTQQYERAYPHLLFVEKNGAPSIDVYLLLSEIEYRRGENEKSLEHLEKAGALGPENPYVQRELGVAYYNKKDYEKAVPVLERNVRRDPKNLDDLQMLGKSYFETKRYPQAANASVQLLREQPASFDAYWTLAWAFYELQDWDRASKAFAAYLQLQPKQAVGEFLLATCFDKLDKVEDALLHYNRFLELDDGSSDVRSFQARERAKTLERRVKR